MTDAHRLVADVVAGRVKPGVYQWRSAAAGRGTWREPAERAGWRTFYLDGHLIRNRAAFLRHCAETFAFPDWFGQNWDALEECLRDLSWLPAANGSLVVYDAWTELAGSDEPVFRTALAVFGEAVEAWRDTATPMTVLLPSAATEVAGVPKLA
ncbi:barstar family protein [Actinomadura atramentaria]|uniref:barstar family protein n=1 Tax=Actinomadura atramentaria TaxID=1990 RepID=UPI00037BDB04|nr:barstar family protein [Actinomadura atramentaria]